MYEPSQQMCAVDRFTEIAQNPADAGCPEAPQLPGPQCPTGGAMHFWQLAGRWTV